jgi:hypothetical protein
MLIKKLIPSPRKNKRFRAVLDDDKYIDFGLLGGNTYIDHHDKTKRINYIKRHLGNPKEEYKIKNFIPSPALLSMLILWGPSTDINENVKILNSIIN